MGAMDRGTASEKEPESRSQKEQRMEGSRFGAYPRETPRYLSRRVHVRKLFKQAAPASVSRRDIREKAQKAQKRRSCYGGPQAGLQSVTP